VTISAIGTSALTSVIIPLGSMPCGRPRREFRSPMTSPTLSSGTESVTSMIGSSSTAPADAIASFIAIDPAVRNACSEESTVW
jgi:hypothetical protein